MINRYIESLFKLRLIVGILGERANHNWWSTSFYAPSSQAFLSPIFSKSSLLAQYHGLIEAARLTHDEHLSVGIYHLFRLPEEIEQDLHILARTHEHGAYVESLKRDAKIALGDLESMATPTSAVAIGPIAVGSIDDLGSQGVLGMIAYAYWSSFIGGERTYPYLTDPS